MIVTEKYEVRADGVVLKRTYSNLGLPIRQVETGIVFDEAIEPENSTFSYEEVNDNDG